MFNLIKADLYKLKKSTSIKVLFILCCIAAIIMYVISNQLTEGNLSYDIVGFGAFVTDFQMITLASVVFIAMFICSDFDNKTVHDCISSGYSRVSIVICKTISYFISVLIFLMPYAIVSIVGICSGNSFEAFLPSVFQSIMKNDAEISFSFMVLLKIICIWITIAIVYASQISICLIIAFSIRKSVIVMSLGYIINTTIAQLVKLDKLSDIFKLTPFGVDYSKLTLEAGASVYGKFILTSVIFMAIIMILSYLSFRKAEIK